MPKWNNIGPIEKYADGNQWLVKIKSRPVALFKHNENYYAIKNSCAHQGYPLAEGNLKGCMVECPLHGWVYDVTNGDCLSLPNKKIPVYRIRENNNCLEIFL
tara:strand:- start:2149 stop:2454 length:306 start_codon:yes stop_codon:yes gene_type:complete